MPHEIQPVHASRDSVPQSADRHSLSLLGYIIELPSDGSETLAHSRQANHALLLTDLQMPNLDGNDLTATIRRNRANPAISPSSP